MSESPSIESSHTRSLFLPLTGLVQVSPSDHLSSSQPLSPASVSFKLSLTRVPPLSSWAECQWFQAPPPQNSSLYRLIWLKPKLLILWFKTIQKLPPYFPNSQDPGPRGTWHDLTSWAFVYLCPDCIAPPYLSAQIWLILQRSAQIPPPPLDLPIRCSRNSFSLSCVHDTVASPLTH